MKVSLNKLRFAGEHYKTPDLVPDGLEALVEPPGFTGDAPGGPSRWSTERIGDWQPLRPELVAEVRYDHVTGRRFRHGTRFLRWRPDKPPAQCRYDQLLHEARPAELASELAAGETREDRSQ